MKPSWLFINLTCLWANVSMAQSLEISSEIGFGSYQLDDFREAQKETLASYNNLDVRETYSFPATVFYGGAIMYNQSPFDVGVLARHTTTGSRISYSDYSGKVRSDVYLEGVAIELVIRKRADLTNKVLMEFGLGAGSIYTTAKFEDYFQVFDFAETNQLKLKSLNFILEPTGGVSYQFWKLALSANLGYQVDVKREKMKSGGNKYGLEADWSGFRAVLALGFIFEDSP